MHIIDCSACIGLDSVNRLIVNHENYPVIERVKQLEHADALLDEMDFAGVDEAYVWHQAMYDTDPTYGNQEILPEIAQSKGCLHATWTLLPPITEVAYAPEKLIPAMKKYKIEALRAFPQRNRFFLDRISCGELLDVLGAQKIPLYLTPMENWEHIFTVMKEFPKLTVIITNYGLWGSDRYFYPLIRAYENLYIDTSDYQVINGLPAFVNKYGSERLLFGSNIPMDNYGGPLCTLFGAGLKLQDLENIAHRNVERVMGGAEL